MPTENKGWIFPRDNSLHVNLTVNNAMLGGTTKIETLVRELIQNGADARQEGGTARLVAQDGTVKTDDIREYVCLDDLKEHIEGTKKFAIQHGNSVRIVPKCDSQLELIASPEMKYFKFSDYNTGGIKGVGGYDDKLAFWKLVMEEGTSAKGSNSAGGVGVGKNATFPFSQLSTVLYVTKTEEGFGVAGTAHLATSEHGGYKYQKKGNLIRYSSLAQVNDDIEGADVKPLTRADFDGIKNDLFYRDEIGSDVIILGTNGNGALEDPEWPYQFAAYAIKNFYLAFKNGIIELTIKHATIEDIEINADNCLDVLDAIEEKISNDDMSRDLEKAIHDARLVIQTVEGPEDDPAYLRKHHDDDAFGNVTLYLNSAVKNGEKEWCLFRSFGMRTVTRGARPQKPVYGVLVIENKAGSDYLLEAESGNHTEYDLQAMGEQKGQKAEKDINGLEKWVKTEMQSFGKVDTANTDIDLAGFSNYISLQDDLKTGNEDGGGTKPLLEIERPKPKTKSRTADKPRKRDGNKADPELNYDQKKGKEQWSHGEGHHDWDHQRDTPQVEDGKTINSETYEREVNVKATFRDVHEPLDSTVEVIGRIESASYCGKPIDIRIRAVNEQNKLNDIVPKISYVTDLKTGEVLAKVVGNVIKDVIVGDDGFVHLKVVYEAPFRGSLYENAITVQTVMKGVAIKEEAKGDTNETNK